MIKTWKERIDFNGPCYPPEAQTEIEELRAALSLAQAESIMAAIKDNGMVHSELLEIET